MTVSSEHLNQASENVKADAVSARKPYKRKFLRTVSVVFAIALALLLIGLGGRIYMERAMSNMVTQSSIQVTGEHRNVLIGWMAGIARQDARAVRFAEVDMEKLNAKYSYNPDGTYTITEPDANKTYDYTLADKGKYTGKKKESYNNALAELNNEAQENYGFEWILLKMSGFCGIFIWIGGIAAVISLIVWLVGGGRRNNKSDTAMITVAAVLAGIGILCIIVCCFVPADFTQHLQGVIEDSAVKMVR